MKCQKSWQNITTFKSNLNGYTNILQGEAWEGAIETMDKMECGSDNPFNKK